MAEIKYTQLFINNELVDSSEGLTFDSINPATEEKIATVQKAGHQDIDRAIKCAREAFENGEWPKLNFHQRGEVIAKFADLINANKDYLATLEATDNGKTKAAALFDVQYSVECLKYYAGYTDKIHGKTYPVTGKRFPPLDRLYIRIHMREGERLGV